MAEMEKRCARCDRAFDCGAATASCWCNDIALTAETLARLRERYDDCLCPDCLRHEAVFATAPSR
jgi:hypothetical protein